MILWIDNTNLWTDCKVLHLPGGDWGLFTLAMAASVFLESCWHRNSIYCKFFNSSIGAVSSAAGHKMTIKVFEQVILYYADRGRQAKKAVAWQRRSMRGDIARGLYKQIQKWNDDAGDWWGLKFFRFMMLLCSRHSNLTVALSPHTRSSGHLTRGVLGYRLWSSFGAHFWVGMLIIFWGVFFEIVWQVHSSGCSARQVPGRFGMLMTFLMVLFNTRSDSPRGGFWESGGWSDWRYVDSRGNWILRSLPPSFPTRVISWHWELVDLPGWLVRGWEGGDAAGHRLWSSVPQKFWLTGVKGQNPFVGVRTVHSTYCGHFITWLPRITKLCLQDQQSHMCLV